MEGLAASIGAFDGSTPMHLGKTQPQQLLDKCAVPRPDIKSAFAARERI